MIGVGRMGAAMAGTLGRAGFQLSVWNRHPGRAEEVARATGAEVALKNRMGSAGMAAPVSLAWPR